ncbi:MAG: hypothetical protein AAFV62_04190 [Pseudomonadota bacterium]
MSRSTASSRDAAIFIALLLGVGYVVMLALPSDEAVVEAVGSASETRSTGDADTATE